ncbi:MAG: carboxypeptidase-like regulatory domain-containing protein, partial [Flavobacteriaceae bacterium]|nr:carboxypeptidase-like regulatory domain-containing protein [Flavobacteriaceae bacterium]
MTKTISNNLRRIPLLLLAFLPVISLAQQSVSGMITDADTGEPLLGVTVLIQGTNKGTVSDFDGNY